MGDGHLCFALVLVGGMFGETKTYNYGCVMCQTRIYPHPEVLLDRVDMIVPVDVHPKQINCLRSRNFGTDSKNVLSACEMA